MAQIEEIDVDLVRKVFYAVLAHAESDVGCEVCGVGRRISRLVRIAGGLPTVAGYDSPRSPARNWTQAEQDETIEEILKVQLPGT